MKERGTRRGVLMILKSFKFQSISDLAKIDTESFLKSIGGSMEILKETRTILNELKMDEKEKIDDGIKTKGKSHSQPSMHARFDRVCGHLTSVSRHLKDNPDEWTMDQLIEMNEL